MCFRPFFLFVAGALSVFAQVCEYKTIAGAAVTFRGEKEPLAKALFHTPSALVVGKDGTIYIADTGNHRVRAIGSDMVIRTIAGTGEPAFRGDGEAAKAAALQSPAGLAIGKDGSIFIADTGNNRVRKVSPDGVIVTIAGEGHARFDGDSGPATAASLNRPKTLGVDSSDNVYIWDSGNYRIRRVDTEGMITTYAGARPLDEYGDSPCCGSLVPQPATNAKTFAPIAFTIAADGALYVSEGYGIGRIDPNGLISTWLAIDQAPEVALESPVPFEKLRITNFGIATAAPDGTIFVNTSVQLIAISGGMARRVGNAIEPNSPVAVDPVTGDLIAIEKRSSIFLQKRDGSRITLWQEPGVAERPSALEAPVKNASGIAVAPDGTIYVAQPDAGLIFAVDPSGQIRRFAGVGAESASFEDGQPALATRLVSPQSLAVDSKSALYFTEPLLRNIRKIGADGIVRTVYRTPLRALSIRIDGQDRVYALSGSGSSWQVLRHNTDGSRTEIASNRLEAFPFPVESIEFTPGMAVSKDGTVYVGVFRPDSKLWVLKVTPEGTTNFLRVETNAYPSALAVAANGDLYGAFGGVIKRIMGDGRTATLRNGDGRGFWGEMGFDSEPSPLFLVRDLTLDSTGGLLATDFNAIRRISTACKGSSGPIIQSVAEAATSNGLLKLAPGQLISIYGSRLGSGVLTSPNQSGHYPLELFGARVFINGKLAPILYSGPSQINAIVPFDLDEQGTASIEVEQNGERSDTFQRPLGRRGPAIFNARSPIQTSPDLFARMLNADGSTNGPQHPAAPGSVVTIFATGLGATSPAGEDGKLADPALKRTVKAANITVGGLEAQIFYEGTAPGIVEGVTQINFRVPEGVTPINECCAVLGIGTAEKTPQPERLLFYVKP